MTKKLFFLVLFSVLSVYSAKAQVNSVDSLVFIANDPLLLPTQAKLEGCWRTKYSQFSYNSSQNFGHEYKSPTRSSAPFFTLKIENDEIYIAWVELTGGENLQKVKQVKKNKLILENLTGNRVVYKRNKGCK